MCTANCEGFYGTPSAQIFKCTATKLCVHTQYTSLSTPLGVVGTRSEGRNEGWMHTRREEGHFYSPPPPTLGVTKIRITSPSGMGSPTDSKQLVSSKYLQ